MNVDSAAVTELLIESARIEILPRFRNLAAADVREKSPGEVVTAADEAMERRLEPGLLKLLPGSVVLGEEAASVAPGLMALLEGAAPVWVIDPLDGTANFASGSPLFGTMVCLVVRAETVAAWIHLPVSGETLTAERGAGAWLDGRRVRVGGPPERLRASISTKFVPPPLKPRIEALRPSLAAHESSHCAATTYTDLVTGNLDLALYYRLLPWDHAAGVLIHAEAGGYARMFDGSAYSPLVHTGGLLAAPDEETWRAITGRFLPVDVHATPRP